MNGTVSKRLQVTCSQYMLINYTIGASYSIQYIGLATQMPSCELAKRNPAGLPDTFHHVLPNAKPKMLHFSTPR